MLGEITHAIFKNLGKLDIFCLQLLFCLLCAFFKKNCLKYAFLYCIVDPYLEDVFECEKYLTEYVT